MLDSVARNLSFVWCGWWPVCINPAVLPGCSIKTAVLLVVPGCSINPARPHSKLPYRGAWLWVGPDMIHLMELPNPDPLAGRPEHGGRDRHACVGVADLAPLMATLEAAKVGRSCLWCPCPSLRP